MQTQYVGPITNLKDKLNDIYLFINTHDKTAIKAPTGSGKSIDIPAVLTRGNKVVYVALQNKNAIYSLQKSQNIFHPELDIGVLDEYHIEIAEKNIVYCTSYALRNKILNIVENNGRIDFCDYIILDEVHTGSAENYIILGLLDYAKTQGHSIPKIVVMSATLNPDNYPSFELMDIKDIKKFDIEITFHNKDFKIKDRKLYDELADIIIKYHNLLSNNKDPFLIFVPGKKEMDWLESKLKSTTGGTIIIPINASTIHDKLKLVYNKDIKVRKIIIATNLLETAITIENIIMVFDTMLEKRMDFSNNSMDILVTEFISKSSATQRAGRTGRTNPGKVYRMITRDGYQLLQEDIPEEINRIDLSNIILSLVKAKISPLKVLPKYVHKKIPQIILDLKDLGLIKITNELSEMGAFYTNFNLKLKPYATLWWLIHTTKNAYFGALIVSYLNYVNQPLVIYEIPTGLSNIEYTLKLKEFREIYHSKYIGKSDLHTFINIWKDFYYFSSGEINNALLINRWSNENKINAKLLKNVNNTLRILIAKLAEYKIPIMIPNVFNMQSTDEIIDSIRPILRRSYESSELILNKKSKYGSYISSKSGSSKHDYHLSRHIILNNYNESLPERLIVFNFKNIDTKYIIQTSLNVDTIHLEDRILTNVDLLSDYIVKMPQRSKVIVSETSIVYDFPVIIDLNKSDKLFAMIPKVGDQMVISLNRKKKITLM
jgi:HrpA-like RNA helicase